ncbi:MAG: dienelactone hydrolase [Hydrogenophaga sp.]|uniref:alpha/beta hydrolase family protein n=1 Tax=Hydrogenophaga sp. TaxID=1904254 RepID=UPI001D456558|nr:dienelactone hydrolase [Hydrogenophaga sp.]MBX3608322.1 dienelactone hydrolase [Hydrogenophaga sp.]
MAWIWRITVALAAWAISLGAQAAMGMAELPADATSGPVVVFYPAAATEATIERGSFRFEAAMDAAPAPGVGRLVVISHGSPASPWVHTGLARALVAAGFVVAVPEHLRDNANDSSDPGPPSWRRRPAEVSAAIDRLQAEPRFRGRFDVNRVGMFGMSAGGHTALTLAGGRWSPARLKEHCLQHLQADYHACAGPATSLSGGSFDGIKMWVVQTVNRFKLDDTSWYQHEDKRITAVVAGVPFAVDFDPASLAQPRTALGIITAGRDRWLVPRYHGDAVLAACAPRCELLLDLPKGGHGALLDPLPPLPSDELKALIGDPPGFDRPRAVAEVRQKVVAFMRRHLGVAP